MNLTDIITKSPMLFMFYYKVVVHENFHNEINLLIIIYVSIYSVSLDLLFAVGREFNPRLDQTKDHNTGIS